MVRQVHILIPDAIFMATHTIISKATPWASGYCQIHCTNGEGVVPKGKLLSEVIPHTFSLCSLYLIYISLSSMMMILISTSLRKPKQLERTSPESHSLIYSSVYVHRRCLTTSLYDADPSTCALGDIPSQLL